MIHQIDASKERIQTEQIEVDVGHTQVNKPGTVLADNNFKSQANLPHMWWSRKTSDIEFGADALTWARKKD